MKDLIWLMLAAGAGLLLFRKRSGDPVTIGQVGGDVSQVDTRGNAITDAIRELLGQSGSVGSLFYSDGQVDLSYVQGPNIAENVFGQRIAPFTSAGSGQRQQSGALPLNQSVEDALMSDPAFVDAIRNPNNVQHQRAEQAVRDFYRLAATSPDPALRREAWLFSWSDPFDDLVEWLKNVFQWNNNP